jgi:CheY-like chemotaxis protein
MGRSGTGLGLAVVWGVVNDHQGFIDVASRKSEGTRIDLYFPSIDSAAAETNAETTDAQKRENKATILVVDDVSEQREVGVAMLEALGYRAHAVGSGEAALRFMATQPVDLLLLDMIMDPGMDGLETFVQARVLNPGQRAVIASGYSKSDRVNKAMAMGAAGFLRKPYRLKNLAEIVEEALKT